jgi:hypothetical protein
VFVAVLCGKELGPFTRGAAISAQRGCGERNSLSATIQK